MRIYLAATAVVAASLFVACSDPELGSLADCTQVAPPVAIETIGDAVPPTTSDADLQAWLAARSYAAFLPESAVHDSAGPHGGVRTFFNRALAESLAGCAASHPVGSAAVKELYDDGEISGWAVMVKTEDGRGADRWFWYEVFSTAPDAEPAFVGQAQEVCTGCHDGGLDAVRARWPLQ